MTTNTNEFVTLLGEFYKWSQDGSSSFNLVYEELDYPQDAFYCLFYEIAEIACNVIDRETAPYVVGVFCYDHCEKDGLPAAIISDLSTEDWGQMLYDGSTERAAKKIKESVRRYLKKNGIVFKSPLQSVDWDGVTNTLLHKDGTPVIAGDKLRSFRGEDFFVGGKGPAQALLHRFGFHPVWQGLLPRCVWSGMEGDGVTISSHDDIQSCLNDLYTDLNMLESGDCAPDHESIQALIDRLEELAGYLGRTLEDTREK